MKKELRKRAFSCLCMSLFAVQLMAQGNKISMKCEQASLPSALYQVEKQSGYYKINYNYGLLKDYKVSAKLDGKTPLEAIQILLASTPYTVKVEGKVINVVRKDKVDGAALRKVSGQLLDSFGAPLVGVSVKVVGSKMGTVTDEMVSMRWMAFLRMPCWSILTWA